MRQGRGAGRGAHARRAAAPGVRPAPPGPDGRGAPRGQAQAGWRAASETREKLRKLLRLGELDDREVEVELSRRRRLPTLSIMTPQGVEEMGVQFKDLLGGLMPKRTQEAPR